MLHYETDCKKDLQNCGINLVLGGGGARGAFHLGLLHYLDEKNIKINAISGVSIGAIIAASYGCGIPPKEQLRLYESKEFNKIYRINIHRGSLLRIDSDHQILQKLIPYEHFEQLMPKISITAFDISNTKPVCFSSGSLLQPLLATSSLPIFFSPVCIGGNYYVDGGLVDNIPTHPFTKGFTVASNLNPLPRSDFKSGFYKNIKRSFRQMWLYSSTQGLAKADMEITTKKLHRFSIIKKQNLQQMFDLGYEQAQESFKL